MLLVFKNKTINFQSLTKIVRFRPVEISAVSIALTIDDLEELNKILRLFI